MIRSQRRIRVPRPPRPLVFDDFSGGVNLIEPDPNRVWDALNMTVVGNAAVKRFGAERLKATTATSKYVFSTPLLTDVYSQEGASLYRYNAPTWTTRTLVHTFSSSAKIAMCEFNGILVVVHPVDGVYTGVTTLTSRSATVQGTCIAVWQNKVWVGGDGTRIYWSNAGDATLWTTAEDFVDIREVDDAAVTALGAGNGVDVVGRSGLMVFKESSRYRIFDSETGEYATLDAQHGAVGAEAVAFTNGRYVHLGKQAVYTFFEDGPSRPVSALIKPMWDSGSSYPSADTYCVFACRGRFYMSHGEVAGGSGDGDVIYEWIPETEAWCLHQLSNAGVKNGVLSAAPYRLSSGAVGVYLLDSDGAAILDMWSAAEGELVGESVFDYVSTDVAARICTPWLSDGGERFRVRRALIEAHGETITWKLHRDFKTNTPETRTGFSLQLDQAALQRYDWREEWDLGVAQALSLQFEQSAAVQATLLPVPVGDDNVSLPGFGISKVRLDVLRLR